MLPKDNYRNPQIVGISHGTWTDLNFGCFPVTTLLYWPIFRPKIGTEGVSHFTALSTVYCVWSMEYGSIINLQVSSFDLQMTNDLLVGVIPWSLSRLNQPRTSLLFHPPAMKTFAEDESVGDTPSISSIAASESGDIESCVDNPINSGFNVVNNLCQDRTRQKKR